MNELRRLHNESEEAFKQLSDSVERIGVIEEHLTQVKDEYNRVVKFSGQAGYVLDEIDRNFQDKTKLTKCDIVLLFLCTAIQCVRQYVFTNDKFRFEPDKSDAGTILKSSSQKGDQFMKDTVGRAVGLVKPQWEEVIFQSVPYDALRKGVHVGDIGLSGTTHRYRTLGHDPILGWIFGTANIMTNSLTKHDFETFQVKDMTIIRHYPNGCIGMMEKAFEYAQDKKLLIASLARQAIHFGSDMFTSQGLPVPLIATVNNDLAKDMLTKWNIDTYSIIRGAGLAAFINNLVFCIHMLFYNESRDGPRSLYEVRTRKILSYSNIIASGSNVLVSACTKDLTKLDVGGILVTLYRLISDYKYIHEIKQEFLEKEFYKKVVGTQYDFMEG